MRRRNLHADNPILSAVLAVLLAVGIQAQNTLISVKKGNRGDKSWAVFTFEKSAGLIGVSQPNMSKLSLYLWGNSGILDGSVITIDKAYDRNVLIRQVHPYIIRADVLNSSQTPMSVLKRSGYVVVAFNDERLLDGSTLLYGVNTDEIGTVTGLSPYFDGKKTTAVMQIDGGFDWIGYVRLTPEQAVLLVRGADLASVPAEHALPEGPLQLFRLAGMQGETSGIRAELQMAPNTVLNVVRKVDALVVQASPSASEPEPSNVAPPLVQEQISDSTFAAVESPAVSPPVSATEVPSQEAVPEVKPVQDNRDAIPWDILVSFEFRNTPIRDALQAVATSNSLNMVITDGVKGNITMKLDNVTLRQAMDKIINIHRCEYTVDGNIITVKPVAVSYAGGRITKVYQLKYADAVNVAKVIKQIVSSDSLVEVFHPEFLDFEVSGRNRMQFNSQTVQGIRRSSVLVVTDRPEKIQEVDQVIRELDKPPVQLFIESRLVEMSPDYSSKLGINWAATTELAFNSLPGGNKALDIYNEGGMQAGREWQMGHLTRNEYATLLDFLQTKTDAKLILNPRVVAMDNEESIISIGQTVPIAQIQRGTGGSGDMVTFTYREISTRLNVTPHVLGDGQVSMYINPVIEEITEWKTLYGSEAPVTDKRSINSIVTVRNGETIVIGGLIKNLKIKKMKKVWLLGSLPLFGKLFQYEDEQETQKDLMIFITPTIVQS